MINHNNLDQSLEDHYVESAWADGDAALQAGRWPHIKLMLDSSPFGVMEEVMARLSRLRREQKEKQIG